MLTNFEKQYFSKTFDTNVTVDIYQQIRNYLIYKWEKCPNKKLDHKIYYKTFLHKFDKNLVLKILKFLESCCLINYGITDENEEDDNDDCEIISEKNGELFKFIIKTNPSIIVIGAGLAGLITAHTLKEYGFSNVTVIEARDRVGGRICTYRHRNFWTDLGCDNFIYTYPEHNQEPNSLNVLCKQIGVNLIDIDSLCPIYEGRVTKIPKVKCQIMEKEFIDMLNTITNFQTKINQSNDTVDIENNDIKNLSIGSAIELLFASKEKFAKHQQFIYLKEKLSYQKQLIDCLNQINIIKDQIKDLCNMDDISKLLNCASILDYFSSNLTTMQSKSGKSTFKLLTQYYKKYNEHNVKREVLEEKLRHMKDHPPCDFYFSFRDRNLLDWHMANFEYQNYACLDKLSIDIIRDEMSPYLNLSNSSSKNNNNDNRNTNYDADQPSGNNHKESHDITILNSYKNKDPLTGENVMIHNSLPTQRYVAIESGFASLPYRLAKDLDVKYGIAVSKIDYSDNTKIRLECHETGEILSRPSKHIANLKANLNECPLTPHFEVELPPLPNINLESDSVNMGDTVSTADRMLLDVDETNTITISSDESLKCSPPDVGSATSSPLVVIEDEKDPCVIYYDADIVVCTLPLGVLKASTNDQLARQKANSFHSFSQNESKFQKPIEPTKIPKNFEQILTSLQLPAKDASKNVKNFNANNPEFDESMTFGGVLKLFNLTFVFYISGLIPLFMRPNPNVVTFEPPLPEDKIQAIQKLGFGLINKVVLHFDKKFWDDYQMFGYVGHSTPESRGEFFLFKCYDKEYATLTAIISGVAALLLEKLTDDILAERCLTILKRIFGNDNVSMPKDIIVTRWGADVWSKGCATFLPPTASRDDIQVLANPIIIKGNKRNALDLKCAESINTDPLDDDNILPSKMILFCGEHTSPTHHGTARGALASGLRETATILQSYLKLVNLNSDTENS